jgi:hypothetical protein
MKIEMIGSEPMKVCKPSRRAGTSIQKSRYNRDGRGTRKAGQFVDGKEER